MSPTTHRGKKSAGTEKGPYVTYNLAVFGVALALKGAGIMMAAQADVYGRLEHGYAVSNGGVKIHYASFGPSSQRPSSS